MGCRANRNCGRIRGLAGSFDDRIAENAREAATLAEMRDTLLPKLISGELQLKDGERFVESLR